jgi:hypothetical protein
VNYEWFKSYVTSKYGIYYNNKNIKRLYDFISSKSKDLIEELNKYEVLTFGRKKTAENFVKRKGLKPEDYFFFGYSKNLFLVFVKKEVIKKEKERTEIDYEKKYFELLLNKKDITEVFELFLSKIVSNKIRNGLIDGKPLGNKELDIIKDYLIRRIGFMFKTSESIGIKFDSGNEEVMKLVNSKKLLIKDIKNIDNEIWVFFTPKL